MHRPPDETHTVRMVPVGQHLLRMFLIEIGTQYTVLSHVRQDGRVRLIIHPAACIPVTLRTAPVKPRP